jgi:hypothetical protein
VKKRDKLRGGAPVPAAPAEDAELPEANGVAPELAEVARAIADQGALLSKIEAQIAARTRALPVYKATLSTDGLVGELRAQRDHAVHTLLARMYHEGREARGEDPRPEAE